MLIVDIKSSARAESRFKTRSFVQSGKRNFLMCVSATLLILPCTDDAAGVEAAIEKHEQDQR